MKKTAHCTHCLQPASPKDQNRNWKIFRNWTSTVKLHQGDDMYRHNGAGEMLVFSAADFEDFVQPRPNLA